MKYLHPRMKSKTLRTLRARWLSAAAGAGIALGVLGLLFGAATLSRAAALDSRSPSTVYVPGLRAAETPVHSQHPPTAAALNR